MACRVPAKYEAPKQDDPASQPVPKGAQERLDEALLNARVKFLEGLKSDKPEEQALYDQLQQQLLADKPKHEPLLLEQLRRKADAAAKDKDHQVLPCT